MGAVNYIALGLCGLLILVLLYVVAELILAATGRHKEATRVHWVILVTAGCFFVFTLIALFAQLANLVVTFAP